MPFRVDHGPWPQRRRRWRAAVSPGAAGTRLRPRALAVTMRDIVPGTRATRMTTSDGPAASSSLDTHLARVADGDRDAFEALYRASASRLLGICLRVLHDRDEAEDALQEVYVRVWRKAGQFDAARAGASTWLATIARNTAIDRLRARPQVQLAPVEMIEAMPDDADTPLDSSARADDRARLDACFETIEPRRRQLIRAAFFDGSTYEELARRVGSPLGSVKSWIRRGLSQLRVCLEQ